MEESQDQATISAEPHALHKVEARIQERVDLGYTVPCGWLFKGLTFFFFVTPDRETADQEEDLPLRLARNTALFASTQLASSLADKHVTHVIANPETLSASDISSLRGSLAARPGKKVPHLVSLEWVQESWRNGSLLDEERTLTPLSHSPFPPSSSIPISRELLITFFRLTKSCVQGSKCVIEMKHLQSLLDSSGMTQ